MQLRRSAAFRFLSSLLIPYMVVVGLPAAARAQMLAPAVPDPGAAVGTPAPAVPMQVAAPQDTEVVQAERAVINPATVPTLPLEEPLDPDKYICGRGDVFELNF